MAKPSEQRERDLSAVLSGITQDYVRQNKPVSFQVTVPGIGDIECIRVYRVISAKRIVCQGRIGGRLLIVKIYHAAHGVRRHWKRSDKGCRAFVERDIPAPGIVFSGYLSQYGVYALVLEYIDGGLRLDRALEGSPIGERRVLLDELMRTLAKHHLSGILQKDLHLGNFMVKDGCIYSLDGDQVDCLRSQIGRGKSLGNLGRLLSFFPGPYLADIHERISVYAGCRGWDITEREIGKIKREILKHRTRKLSEYLGKIFKSRDPFIVRRDERTFYVCDKRQRDIPVPEVLAYAKSVHAGGKGTYNRISFSNKDMMVWSSPGYGPLKFKRLWKAGRMWKNTLMLLRLGIQTPQPVALVIIKSGFMTWSCFVFFTPVEERTLKDLLGSGHASEQEKNRFIENFADACSLLKETGFFMDRMNPDEILAIGDYPIFLGVDSVRSSCWWTRDRFSRQLKEFISRLEVSPGITAKFTEQFMKRNLI